ncbi:MAG: polysaccharide biosynthesis tyrosine autokinase [Lachnospiraceae bacterium]|nr:polysaccharide biosynthesis tyrosine autokinase [Lachnospiraceae bacterium]
MQEVNIGKLNKLDYSSNEAYKSLRTNIEFCGKEIKVIGLTSCIPNEGKSSVSINIARSFAESGKRVLLIDSDMRKSVMVGRYRISSKGLNGLSHLLSGYRDVEEVMCETNIENFYILLSGPTPPNPSELLGNERFKDFIKTAKEYVDYIIIDCPPLGSVIDAAVISQVCDGMALVLSANEISYKFAQNVKAQLEKTDCRILGVILNKVRMRENGYYYGRYYGKYYGKYYGNYYGNSGKSGK